VRPILRPGVRLLRRDRFTWQFGLDWPGASVVADSPALEAVLGSLDGVRDHDAVVYAAAADGGLDADSCARTLDALIDRGLVTDGDHVRPGDVGEQAWAAWSLLAGRTGCAGDIDGRRRSASVAVDGSGAVADEIRRLLAGANVGTAEPGSGANVTVLAADSEPSRERADSALHTGLPHLWSSIRDCVGLVGPFVVPGETGCLRCADLARADVDPAWPTLVEAATRAGPVVDAVDRPLAATVAALAVHEIAVWASGLGPQTLGGVIEVPYGFGPIQRVGVQQHPQCGCGWPTWSDTMGA
jgi:bacteriocin biosynthesis cyclodehydratase domain-containing protein